MSIWGQLANCCPTIAIGAVIANLIALPIADKLALRSEQERLNKSIIVEAAIAINRGVSPMVLEESLKIFLSPKNRNNPAAEEPKGEAN